MATNQHATAINEDQDYQRRLKGWLGFARLMRWVIAHIVVILILMAYFLL